MTNREICFRAYDTVKKEWLLGTNEDPFHIVGEVTVFELLKEYRLIDYDNVFITEFSGLFDKNGKRIFEGDKVRITEPNSTFVRECKFIGSAFGFESSVGLYIPLSENMEIIGNVFDSLELIK
jgi:uncharacterized phage protein (TIGR01671 family)